MQISLMNRAHLPQPDIDAYLSAQNVQLGQFFKWWGLGSNISEDTNVDVIVYLVTEMDVENALGYHDATARGIPFGVVDVQLATKLGEPWTVTASHEVLELLGDQLVNDFSLGPHPVSRRLVFHWHEMCDAVQADSYPINGVMMSNFVLPHYFTINEEEGAQNDYLNLGLKSFGCRPGGYIGFYDPKVEDHVTWSPDQRGRVRSNTKEGHFGRRALRRMLRP